MKDQILEQCLNDTGRSNLTTEKENVKSRNLHKLETKELVELFSQEDVEPQKAVAQALPEITKAIDLISQKLSKGGRLFYLGAGTSGRLGVLDASECPPTFCTDPELVQGIIAGGDDSLRSSSEELEDQEKSSIVDLEKRKFNKNDCLVGITAGGTTPYVIRALKYAKSIKASSIVITSVSIKQAKIIADIEIRLLTGPELLTGSTRLKAGTATKMTLNMISTIVMIKLGRVYDNKMIDVSATNKKLVDRSIRIIQEICKLDRIQAISLLKASKGSTKRAVLMSIKDIDNQKAERLLEKCNENINLALNHFIENETSL